MKTSIPIPNTLAASSRGWDIQSQSVEGTSCPHHSSQSATRIIWLFNTTIKTILLAILALLISLTSSIAETQDERDARMAWWRDARFGMFVHWGLYSGLAGNWNGQHVTGEQDSMLVPIRLKLDAESYAKAAIPKFQPKPGFAAAWAKLARAAGCRYIVLTTKHHDGFALHDSKFGSCHAGATLQRDLLREFVDAARAEGLRVGFYHSVIDWHHDQYEYSRSTLLPHPLRGQPYPNGTRDHSKYLDFLHGQVNELLTNYGTVDVLWFDYSAPDLQGQDGWRAFDLIKAVREKQPGAIINNRLFRSEEAGWNVQAGKSGSRLDPKFGDFLTPEQYIPDGGKGTVDWETCMTQNNIWGYSDYDHDWKSPESLIRKLIDIASKGGNFLLNIGPKADGSIPEPSIDAFQTIGRWMEIHSESIYGTTASPIAETPFGGRITAKGETLYLHLFSRPADGRITLPRRGSRAVMLDGGQSLKVTHDDKQTIIHLPSSLPDPVASVIRLE